LTPGPGQVQVLRHDLTTPGLPVTDAVLPLDMLRPGEWGDVTEVHGDPGWVGRMAELGVRPGCRLRLLQPGQPCLLQVGGCRLCLRGHDAAAILVRPVTGPA
jgi:ferrous iron transport protein A